MINLPFLFAVFSQYILSLTSSRRLREHFLSEPLALIMKFPNRVVTD